MKIEPVLYSTLKKVSNNELTSAEAFDIISELFIDELYSLESKITMEMIEIQEEWSKDVVTLNEQIDVLIKKHRDEKAELVKEINRLENKLRLE